MGHDDLKTIWGGNKSIPVYRAKDMDMALISLWTKFIVFFQLHKPTFRSYDSNEERFHMYLPKTHLIFLEIYKWF